METTARMDHLQSENALRQARLAVDAIKQYFHESCLGDCAEELETIRSALAVLDAGLRVSRDSN
jgi:hypothetical protein